MNDRLVDMNVPKKTKREHFIRDKSMSYLPVGKRVRTLYENSKHTLAEKTTFR
jgi:hypothetical protein